MTRLLHLIARVLHAIANALTPDVDVAVATPVRRLQIVDAPPGTPEPEPFQHVEPGDELDAANQLLARIYLERAMRRYSPVRTIYA